jgi:hypothetical protein
MASLKGSEVRVVPPRALATGEEKALAVVAANRDNPKIKNRVKCMKTGHIAKVNHDKSAASASPNLRPAAFLYGESR